MKVKRVFNIEELNNPESKKIGTCAIEFDNGVTIHRWSIVAWKESYFVGPPSMKVTAADGTSKYSDMVEVTKEMKFDINKAVLDAAGLALPNG